MNVWDKLYIRDFLIACLMVIGGGHRSDVIRNMTLEEWNDRKIEEGEDEENQVPGNYSYTGKLWYRMCSCKPTLEKASMQVLLKTKLLCNVKTR